MSEAMLTIEDAARRLADVVEQVHAKGEAAVLLKSGRPIARIVPIAPAEDVSDELIAFLGQWRLEYPEPDEELADAIFAVNVGGHGILLNLNSRSPRRAGFTVM